MRNEDSDQTARMRRHLPWAHMSEGTFCDAADIHVRCNV